jgi:sec-independent protein translocase protein TatA
MFGSLGPLEIGLIAIVVVLLFGVGKFAGLGKDLGTSIKEFRRAVKDEDAEAAKNAPVQPAQTQATTAEPPVQPQPQPQAPGEKSKNVF